MIFSKMKLQNFNQTKFLDLAFLLLILSGSLIFRLSYLQASNFVIDADEAIVGIMGKRFLEGEPVSTFYYGQHYMGSLEGILAGFVFSLIGVSSFSLKLVPLIFTLIFVICIFEITKRLSNRNSAYCASFLAAFPGQVLLDWGTKARGGFIEVIVIGALALTVIIPWFRDQQRWRLFLASFLLGVGWWVNNQIIFFMITIGIFVLGSLIHSLRSLASKFYDVLFGLIFFIVGGAPFWIYNINNHFISFQMFNSAKESHALDYLFGMIFVSLPMLGGAKKFWGEEDIWLGSSLVFGVIAIILLSRILWIYKSDLKKLLLKFNPGEKPALILVAFIIITGAVFSLSSFGHLYKAPRYLLPIYVAWFPLIGIGICSFWEKSKTLAIILYAGVLTLQLGSDFSNKTFSIPGQPHVVGKERVAKDHTLIANWLIDNKIDFIRTDYWIGNRLSFETSEKVRFLAFDDPEVNRVPGYLEEANSKDKALIPLLLVKGQLRAVEASLLAQGIKFNKELIEPYWILFNLQYERTLDSKIPIISAESSDVPQDTHLAFDGDINTRWGVGSKQTPNMYFKSQFSKPVDVCAIRYRIGAFGDDLPSLLTIIGIDRIGNEHEILSEVRYKQMKVLVDAQDSFEIKIDPPMEFSAVKLIQLGKNLDRNWSIPELEFYNSCKVKS